MNKIVIILILIFGASFTVAQERSKKEKTHEVLVPPSVTTTGMTNIGEYSAVGLGNVTDEGSSTITVRGICWNETGTPTTSDNVEDDVSVGSGTYSLTISTLTSGATYYIRAYATNSVGTTYGSEVSFTTQKASSGVYYQGVLRNSSGTVLESNDASVKIEIERDSDNSTVYSEIQDIRSNELGMFLVEIGSGSVLSGNFGDIDVNSYTYTVTVSVDETTPYGTYRVVEAKKFMAFVIESTKKIVKSGGSVSGGTSGSGMLKSFPTLEDRDGWTFTGQSETKGTPNTWTTMSKAGMPSARYYHNAVWTGEEMIAWGGRDIDGVFLNDGAIYNPSTNSWRAMSSTNAPSTRDQFAAVWTGEEMIVWGGYDGTNVLGTGARYNLETDTWTTMSTTNAHTSSFQHWYIWTGEEMIVWGGYDNSNYLNTGAKYDPVTDSWSSISTTNAPEVKYRSSIVWTGKEMIIWGGFDNNETDYTQTGKRYNPTTDTWTTMTTASAPGIRGQHAAVWTGNEMIIWSGEDDHLTYNTVSSGGIYDPDTDSWTAMTTTNAPSSRESGRNEQLPAVWTGEEMLIWTGRYYNNPVSGMGKRDVSNAGTWVNNTDGGRYNPETDTWTSLPTTNAPSGRYSAAAVWTGSEYIIWGGYDGSTALNTGAVLSGAQSIYWYKKN